MPFVPGRIEFLGKHTDYCGGESLVCPIDRGFRFEFGDRSDSIVEIRNRDSGELVRFDLNDIHPQTGWGNYAATVAARLRSNFEVSKGVGIDFTSDLAQAAGMSSSSALMIMVYRAIAAVNRLDESTFFQTNIKDELDLADYLGCIENGRSFRELAGSAGVGTFGGSQDHAAIAAGRPGTITRFAFGPLRRIEDIAFPSRFSFVIAASGVVAEKTGAAKEKYNRISLMVSEITSAFPGRTLAAILREAGIDELERIVQRMSSRFTTAELLNRVRQFEEESFRIIPNVARLIAAGRIDEIGRWIDRSQENAESMLGNQVPETVQLQRSARRLGAPAASAFGAGFGGSVYALVESHDAEAFLREWRKDYESTFLDRKPQFFIAGAADDVSRNESDPFSKTGKKEV